MTTSSVFKDKIRYTIIEVDSTMYLEISENGTTVKFPITKAVLDTLTNMISK